MTSLVRQVRMFPGRYFETSLERHLGKSPLCQIGTSPRWSSMIIRGRPVDVGIDVGRRHPRDVLGTNICRLGGNMIISHSNVMFPTYRNNLLDSHDKSVEWVSIRWYSWLQDNHAFF